MGAKQNQTKPLQPAKGSHTGTVQLQVYDAYHFHLFGFWIIIIYQLIAMTAITVSMQKGATTKQGRLLYKHAL